jgi:DNA-binding beta-propeller fold protein YncE
MFNLKTYLFTVLAGGLMFFSSCDDNGNEKPVIITNILIVNEGNFGAGNGSLSIYDEEQKTITNSVVKNANQGSEIGSSIQSLFAHDGIGYIVCNSSDKIEFISLDDYTFLANPLTNISTPRYMAIVEGKGYITCWGPWASDFTLQNSYIAVMDLSSRAIIDTLECGSGPEGIMAVGNKLFVANSFESSVSVLNLNDNAHTKIELDGAPQHFALDASGTLWVSISSGLQPVNPSTNVKGTAIAVADMGSKITIDGHGLKIYLLTAEPWNVGTGAEVYGFNTQTKQLDAQALISGDSFYGIGFNVTSDKIYVADSKGFSGNGVITVYDTEGNMLDQQTTGVGPNGFVFK